MAWEENSCICLNMQLIAILSRIGVYISDVINKAATLPPRTPISKYRELLPDKWKQKNIAQE